MKNLFRSGRPAHDGESWSLHQNVSTMPLTDWSFQAATPALRGGSFEKRRSVFRALRDMSETYFGEEAKREDRIESAVFGAIGLLSAWPITMAAHAIIGLIK